jgi:hypothetical protein
MQNGKVIKNFFKILENSIELPNANEIELENQKAKLLSEIETQKKEIEKKEKEYLAKIAKLLVMTQVHCEIKTEINQKFDDMGVSIKKLENVEELEKEDE